MTMSLSMFFHKNTYFQDLSRHNVDIDRYSNMIHIPLAVHILIFIQLDRCAEKRVLLKSGILNTYNTLTHRLVLTRVQLALFLNLLRSDP